MTSPSLYVDRNLVGRVVVPFIDRVVISAMMAGEYGKDPSCPTQLGICVAIEATDLPFKECVVYRNLFSVPGVVGDPSYMENAFLKAQSHHRTGRPSGELITRMPALLRPGDFAWAGSVSVNGIIVAVSGLKDYWDEQVSGQVGQLLSGEVMHVHQLNLAEMRVRKANTF